MVFNCTLCGMGPRATIVLVGLLSLLFSAGYVLFTTAGVLAHNCVLPMNNSIEEYAIYVYYLRNAECGKINITNLGIANVPADFQIDVPDVSDAGHRTYILCIVGLVIYGLWFITSLFLLTSACVSCLGRCGIAFGIYPYVVVLFLVLAFDIVGLVFYMIDFVASFELDFVLDLLEIKNQDVVRPFFEKIDDIFLIVPPLIFWITASKGVIIWFIFFLLAFVMLGVGSRLWEENKPAPPYSSVDPRTAQAATAPVEMAEESRTVAAVRYTDPARQPNDQLVYQPPPPVTHTPMVINNNNNVVRRTVEPLKVGYDQPPYIAEPPVYRSNEAPGPLRNTLLNPYTDKRFSYTPGNAQPFSYLAGPPQMSPRNSTNVPEVRSQLPWSYMPSAGGGGGGVEEPKRITSTLTESKDFDGQEVSTPTSKPGSEDRSSDEGKWSGPEYRY